MHVHVVNGIAHTKQTAAETTHHATRAVHSLAHRGEIRSTFTTYLQTHEQRTSQIDCGRPSAQCRPVSVFFSSQEPSSASVRMVRSGKMAFTQSG